MADLNPLYDPKTDNLPIDPAVQSMINQPLKDQSGFSPEDQTLLNQLMQKVEDGSINLYQPSSLLNAAVYDTLSPEMKGKADQNAVILLVEIREIVNLMKLSQEPTYQVKNLVQSLNITKSRLEEAGNIFII